MQELVGVHSTLRNMLNRWDDTSNTWQDGQYQPYATAVTASQRDIVTCND